MSRHIVNVNAPWSTWQRHRIFFLTAPWSGNKIAYSRQVLLPYHTKGFVFSMLAALLPLLYYMHRWHSLTAYQGLPHSSPPIQNADVASSDFIEWVILLVPMPGLVDEKNQVFILKNTAEAFSIFSFTFSLLFCFAGLVKICWHWHWEERDWRWTGVTAGREKDGESQTEMW